ncbi:receptor-type tyrosine-protein phosphatase F-like isoform X1 [Glandiceps talaboti]
MTNSPFFLPLIALHFITLAAAGLDISSEKSTYRVGETITINCTTVAQSASDVEWYFDSNLIPEDSYKVLQPNLSQLVITNVNFSDAGKYSCVLSNSDDESQTDIDIQVGKEPIPVVNFSCHSFNGEDMLCTWDEGGHHNIPTNYSFTYRSYYYGLEWRECPDNKMTIDCPQIHNFTHSCYMTYEEDHIESRQSVFVRVSNELGTETTSIEYNPHLEAKPFYPSNIQVSPQRDGCLHVELDLPCSLTELQSYWADLQYKIRYRSEWESEDWNTVTVEWDQSREICELDGYTNYDVQVAAAFSPGSGWSKWSDTVTVRTVEQAPTTRLKIPRVRSENSDLEDSRDVIVQWEPLTRRQMRGVVLRYTVKLIKGEFEVVAEVNKSADARIHDFQALKKFKSYKVSVVTWNSAGSSPPATVDILDLTSAPSEPVNVSATTSNKTSINVSWDPPLNPNGDIIKYQVCLRQVHLESEANESLRTFATINVIEDSQNNLQYQFTGLEDKYLQYEIYVQAFTTAAGGGFSQVIKVNTPEGVPYGSAKHVKIELQENKPHNLEIIFQHPCGDERNGIIRGYLLYYCEVQSQIAQVDCPDDTVLRKNISVDGTEKQVSTEIDGLKSYTLYAVWMAAYTTLGIPGPNSTVGVKRTGQGEPGKPRKVKVMNETATSIVIEWEEPIEKNGVIQSYEVKYDDDIKRYPINGNSTNVVLDGLNGFTDYIIEIRACTEATCGNYSKGVIATTKIGAPGTPQSLKVVAKTSQSVILSFNVPSHANGPSERINYIVFYKKVDENAWTTQNIGVYPEAGRTVLPIKCNDDGAQKYEFALKAQIEVNGDILQSEISGQSQPLTLCHNSPDVVFIAALTTVLTITPLCFVILAVCVYRKYKKSDFAKPIPEVKLPKRNSEYRVTLNLFNYEEEYDLLENQTKIKQAANGVIGDQQDGQAGGVVYVPQTSASRLNEECQAPIYEDEDEDEDDIFSFLTRTFQSSRKQPLTVQIPAESVNIDDRLPSVLSPDSAISLGSPIHQKNHLMNIQVLGQYANVNGRSPLTPGPDSGFFGSSTSYYNDSVFRMESDLPIGCRRGFVSEYLEMTNGNTSY